jgi:hypothetical protein
VGKNIGNYVHQLDDGRWFVGQPLQDSAGVLFRVPLLDGGYHDASKAVLALGGLTPLYLRQNVAKRHAAKILAAEEAAAPVTVLDDKTPAPDTTAPTTMPFEPVKWALALRDVREILWPNPWVPDSAEMIFRIRERLSFLRPAIILLALLGALASACTSEGPPVCEDGKAWSLVIAPCDGATELATCARESASGSRTNPAVDCTPAPAYESAVTCVSVCPAVRQ